jgi:hypothetical protein
MTPMKRSFLLFALVALSLAATPPVPSGAVGIYGIIERVSFEPNDRAPDRIRVWGVFAYAEGGVRSLRTSDPERGYMYFQHAKYTDSAAVRATRAEWMDLKAVAGTGQAVGFGHWVYPGRFSQQPNVGAQAGYAAYDLRVHLPSDSLAWAPVSYDTNIGVVKLTETSHGSVIRALRDALKRK